MTDYVLKAPFNLFNPLNQLSDSDQLEVAKRYLNMVAGSFPETNESNPDFRLMILKDLAKRGLDIMDGTLEPYPDCIG